VAVLKELAGRGLTAGVVLANLHHRRVVPLMERPLRIYEMTEIADPVALAKSRLLPTPFPWAFAATRPRRTIDPKSGRCDDKALWELEMLPTGPLVSGVLDFISNFASFLSCWRILMLRLQMVRVSAAKSELPTPRSHALARAAQQRERERVARRRERATRHQERRERRSEEFRLREQQGLSSPGTDRHRTRKRRKRLGSMSSPIGGSLHPRHRSRLRWQE
jgi:hypothetical protein